LSVTTVLTASAAVITETKIAGVDVEIRRSGNDAYPLIIFSHGMGACPAYASGLQDRLADAGYIVIAPKHADCISGSTKADVPWRDAKRWSDQTNRDRRDDIHALLDALPSSQYAKHIASFEKVGCMGHSMGGYTCMGVGGAWQSWKRPEITAIAALSPWHRPFLEQGHVSDMKGVSLLYQGGTHDRPITPELTKPNGTFNQTLTAKYMQVFKRARHGAWSDRRLSSRFHDDISYYLIAFYDAYLKGGAVEKLEMKKSKVDSLRFKHTH